MANVSKIRLPDNSEVNIFSYNTSAIPFAQVDSTSTSTAFTATVPGITELKDGTCVMLYNGVVSSAAGCTLNINNLGAKPLFSNLTAATRDTTIFNASYTMLFVYDSTRVVDSITGAWCCYRGYDSNSNTIGYQLRTNSQSLPMKSITYRYRILFTSADREHFVPANNSSSTNATASRTVCQDAIDPFGQIVYYGTTTSVAAGSTPDATVLWSQNTITLGYSFNRTGAALTLTSWKPVYVKCAPQSDGSAIIDSTTPYVQALPTTEDGKIYIFLGVAYSETKIELLPEHPVYYYSDGVIKPWTNSTTIKKAGFAQNIFYNPAGSYDTYISLFNHDKAQATAQDPKYAVEAISTRTENDKYFIDITLGNRVRQSYTNSNNNYPLAIAGMQYSNMTSGNCLPVYYSPNIQVNPSTGILSVNDVNISGTSVATAISSIEPSQVFIAEYGETSYADCSDAYYDGKIIFCRWMSGSDLYMLPCTYLSDTDIDPYIIFEGIIEGDYTTIVLVYRTTGVPQGEEGDYWTKRVEGGIETTNNKVTSISSSSTDSQYPTAKAVYDTVEQLPQILSGTADPSSSLGKDGDLYIKISS